MNTHLLNVLICICYAGFGLNTASIKEVKSRFNERFFWERFLIILLWPVIVIIYVFIGFNEKK